MYHRLRGLQSQQCDPTKVTICSWNIHDRDRHKAAIWLAMHQLDVDVDHAKVDHCKRTLDNSITAGALSWSASWQSQLMGIVICAPIYSGSADREQYYYMYTPCPEKRGQSFFSITLTNVDIVL